MPSVNRQYYSAKELASEWKCDISDIFHLIETNQLQFEVHLKNVPAKIYERLSIKLQNCGTLETYIAHAEGYISGIFSINENDKYKLLSNQSIILKKVRPSLNGVILVTDDLPELGTPTHAREPKNALDSSHIENRNFNGERKDKNAFVFILEMLSSYNSNFKTYISSLNEPLLDYIAYKDFDDEDRHFAHHQAREILFEKIFNYSKNYKFFNCNFTTLKCDKIPDAENIIFHLLPKHADFGEYGFIDDSFDITEFETTEAAFDYSDLVITIEDIRITKSEREKYESFGAQELREAKINELETLYRIIGGLTHLLYEKCGEKYKTGKKPNTSAIWRGVTEIADRLELPKKNIASSNFSKEIGKGLKIFLDE